MSNPRPGCGHCGRPGVGSFERGWGKDANGTPLCHPNDDGPDCYTLVTRERHTTPCARCEPWDECGPEVDGKPDHGWTCDCDECEADRAYARAEARGEALARKMHADGSLRARSPRRTI